MSWAKIYENSWFGYTTKTALSIYNAAATNYFQSAFILKNRITTETATQEADYCLDKELHKTANQ